MTSYYRLILVVFFVNAGLIIYSNYKTKEKIQNLEKQIYEISEQNNRVLYQNQELISLLKAIKDKESSIDGKLPYTEPPMNTRVRCFSIFSFTPQKNVSVF